MKAIIEFLYHPNTKSQPVLDVMEKLLNSDSRDDLQLFKLVLRGLEFLEGFGLSEARARYFETTRDDGLPYTIKLVKYLKYHRPLLEFRVNWAGAGAFRATFFEYHHPSINKQILIFIDAVVKQSTSDPEFELMAKQSGTIYAHFIKHPEKYITFKE